ncbi:MAG: WecB/TagA/CpsF family glycosyltransferase [Planctomycetes bacterium]|nr:WecB/TagA/CpsF family glycosyltransferase [Planctomycetota bacterium]
MIRTATETRRGELFGVPLDALTMAEVLDRIDTSIARREPLLMGVVNAAKVVNMRRDPELRRSVLAADLIVADGMAVVWAARLLGLPVPERVPGIDLMERLLERGNEKGYRVFCLGAKQDVLQAVMNKIRTENPGVALVGGRDGYYSESDEPEIAAQIEAARPDLLFVAMSSPKKEQFLERWAGRMGVPVCHGVGGAFDVLAGVVRRAPVAWQRLGLEWLYRVLQEPRRMWWRYLITNTIFCAMLTRDLLRKPGRRQRGAASATQAQRRRPDPPRLNGHG